MGSFDVGCGMSNLPIHEGDKAGIILLGLNKYGDDSDDTGLKYGRTMQIYTTDRFYPYLPPVYGTYDDYGRLTDIQESITTKVLEKRFGLPVEELLDCIGNNARTPY